MSKGLQLSTFFKSCYFRPECPTERALVDGRESGPLMAMVQGGQPAGRGAAGVGGCSPTTQRSPVAKVMGRTQPSLQVVSPLKT